jgi:addiction module HigA family antidote
LTYIVALPRLPRRKRDAALYAPLGRRLAMTPAVHPGQVLAHKLQSVGVSPTELARQLHVPANRITQIIAGKRDITADSALRLAHWFGNTPEFWMNLQAQHDLQAASGRKRSA